MSDKSAPPSFGDEPTQSAHPAAEGYSERTEDELQGLRDTVQRNSFGPRNYVALPDEGYDVEGIWFNFPADSRSGYSTASYGLAHALERVTPHLQLIPHRGRPIDPERFPPDRKVFLDQLLTGKVGLPQIIIVASAPTEAIPMGGRLSIPWTTMEGDRINPAIAARMNDPNIFQRIWAKSKFAADAFCDSGVSRDRIDIVRPCLFWHDLYRGYAEQPGARDAAYRARQQEGGTLQGIVADAYPIREYHPRPVVDPEGTFRFGYCAAWLARKGHRDLLRAYFSTFSRDEAVVLEIKTAPMNSFTQLYQLKQDIMKTVESAREGLAEPPAGWPRVRFELGSDWSDVELMEWIASLDCFANASYGEGTGIPQTWAMGMGVPLITTMFGGVGETIHAVRERMVEVDYNPAPRVEDFRVHIVEHHLAHAPSEMQRVDAIWDSSVRWGEYNFEAFGQAMRKAASANLPALGLTRNPDPQRPPARYVRSMYGINGVCHQLQSAIAKTTAAHLIA